MIRIGVVGCGRVGREVHLPVLGRRSDTRVVALAEPDEGGRAEAARVVRGARCFSSWQAFVKDADVDAVVIASPPDTHSDVAVAALERVWHVYIENPMTIDLTSARTLVEAWKRSGRVAMVGFNYRFNPLYAQARELIRQDVLGVQWRDADT